MLHKLWGSFASANPSDPVHGQQQHQLHPPHPRQQQKRPCPRIGLGQHVSTLWSSRTTSTQFHLFTTFSNIHVSSLSNCEMRIIFNWMMNSCLCRLTFFFMDLPLREGTEAACVYFKVEVHRQPLSLITRTQFQFINGILACTLYYFLIPVSMKESFGFHFGELLLGWHEGQTNSKMIGNRSRHPGLLMLHKKQPNLYDSAW